MRKKKSSAATERRFIINFGKHFPICNPYYSLFAHRSDEADRQTIYTASSIIGRLPACEKKKQINPLAYSQGQGENEDIKKKETQMLNLCNAREQRTQGTSKELEDFGAGGGGESGRNTCRKCRKKTPCERGKKCICILKSREKMPNASKQGKGENFIALIRGRYSSSYRSPTSNDHQPGSETQTISMTTIPLPIPRPDCNH